MNEQQNDILPQPRVTGERSDVPVYSDGSSEPQVYRPEVAGPASTERPETPPPSVPPPSVPSPAQPAPQGSAPTGSTQTSDDPDDTPMIADDVDLIEKEWVHKAKEIVDRTKEDPYLQNKEIGRLRADYMKKRYDKDIKLQKDE
ncbi:hypothetical protein BH23PAT2_BH23PAT2_07080 [soil metagenome]